MAKKKLYILDTNVLIHDPKAFLRFEKASVGIPLTVIEELDRFKGDHSQRGFSARETIRILDHLRKQGSLRDGVALEHGGNLQVLAFDPDKKCDHKFKFNGPDDQILNVALCEQAAGRSVELITKDLNMRVKADALGLHAVDYEHDVVSREEFYRGWRTIQVPAVELKQDVPTTAQKLADGQELEYNEYVIVEAQHNEHNYRIFRYGGGKKLVPVHTPHLANWNFAPRNRGQIMALDLLLNNDIPLVTLSGPAGTGKTLLVLVAALYKVLVEEAYAKLIVSRPIIPLGPDIGYLPGELQEKLYNWMQPVYDNMELIAHIVQESDPGISNEQPPDKYQKKGIRYEQHQNGDHRGRHRGKNGHKDHRRHHHDPGMRYSLPHLLSIENLIAHDKLSLEAITYMRGRSIPYRYIFIDEVQNLTPHEVKTIVSRVGEGSKIVLAGDPYQIDSPYLDFASNGLMVLAERFKGQKLFGTVFLEHSERSPLSKLAAELL